MTDYVAIVDRGFTLLMWAYAPTDEQKECYGEKVRFPEIINLDTLDIMDGEECILGQLSGGEYVFLLREMMIRAYGMQQHDIDAWHAMSYKPNRAIIDAFAYDHGFICDHKDRFLLTNAWKQAIREWRQTQAEKTYRN